MGKQLSWLVRLIARALEPRECEIVLGDLAESGLSGPGVLRQILGIVVRRQVLIWTGWRPWVALICVVGVSGFFLSRMLTSLSIGIFEQVTAWRRFGVHYNTGVTSFRDDMIHMSCLAAAIFCWTAVNASLLSRLSGRAKWLTATLFYVVVLDSFAVWSILSGSVTSRGHLPWWTALRWILPLNPASLLLVVFLFAIPAVCGACERLPALTAATVLTTLAAAVLGASHSHDLQTFSNGAFPAPPWSAILAPYVLVSWPLIMRNGPLRLRR